MKRKKHIGRDGVARTAEDHYRFLRRDASVWHELARTSCTTSRNYALARKAELDAEAQAFKAKYLEE